MDCKSRVWWLRVLSCYGERRGDVCILVTSTLVTAWSSCIMRIWRRLGSANSSSFFPLFLDDESWARRSGDMTATAFGTSKKREATYSTYSRCMGYYVSQASQDYS